MDHSNDLRRLRESLEVSRPGDLATSPDVAQALADDPQLRVAFERIQGWDGAISAAMDRVELPPAFEQRILARLAADISSFSPAATLGSATSAGSPTLSGVVAAAASSANEPSGESVEAVTLAPEAASRSVRPLTYWSSVGLAAVTAAALVIAAGYWLQLDSEVAIDQLAQQWQGKLSNQWQPIASAPADFPFPEAMRVAATGWQWIGKLTPTPVVAFRLTDGKTTALLYAARMTREGLVTSPRKDPQQDTGGKAIGYWRSPQKQGLVYVLVVEDAKRYGFFVRSASTPLAIHWPLRFNSAPACSARPTARARKIA